MSTPRFKRIAIDYGHGGWRDGRYQSNDKQYQFTDVPDWFWIGEGIVNRQVAWRLMNMLRENGVEVHDIVRGAQVNSIQSFQTLEQANVDLNTRVAYANRLPVDTFLLSIHSNATGNSLVGPSQPTRGTCFFTSPGQTTSDVVATILFETFSRRLGSTFRMLSDNQDGDPDFEADFAVTGRTRCPAVLGEVGFFTNREDAAYLASPAGQLTIARTYHEALLPLFA